MQSPHNDEFQQVIDAPNVYLANVEQSHSLECGSGTEQFSTSLLNEVDVIDRIQFEEFSLNEVADQHSSTSEIDDDDVTALAALEPNQNHDRYINGQAVPTPHSNTLLHYTNEGYPNDSIEKYGEDKWSEVYHYPPNSDSLYYIRNQLRTETSVLPVSEDSIKLDELQQKYENGRENERYWYHATRWEYAEQILQTGPRISTKRSDLAVNGAFYLNPSYADCYEWFPTEDKKFDGFDAMLIYKFDPWILSKKGEELTYQRWKEIVNERSTNRKDQCKLDWCFAFQNASPRKVRERKHQPKGRAANDGNRAMQLVVYNNEMCSKIHSCLVGCVFYKNIKPRMMKSKHLCSSASAPSHRRCRRSRK